MLSSNSTPFDRGQRPRRLCVETMATAGAEPLDIDTLRASRRDARIGRDIRYFETLPSTNTTARELAASGVAEGAVVIAEGQTAGRGRLGRSWVSPPFRNLYLTLVLRPPLPPGQAPLLALVAGLATAEALATFGIDARLKWPNDVLVEGRKVAGLLAEMDSDGDRLAAVLLGIGVNVNLAIDEFPEELRDKAGSLAAAVGQDVSRATVAERLLSSFERRYDRFLSDGFAALREDWNRLSCLGARRVEILDGDRRVVGTVLGMADDGSLEIRGDDGNIQRIVAGEVTVVDGYSRG